MFGVVGNASENSPQVVSVSTFELLQYRPKVLFSMRNLPRMLVGFLVPDRESLFSKEKI